MNMDFWPDGCIILKSDRINSMDHTCVSGNEPSSVILCKKISIMKLHE